MCRRGRWAGRFGHDEDRGARKELVRRRDQTRYWAAAGRPGGAGEIVENKYKGPFIENFRRWGTSPSGKGSCWQAGHLRKLVLH